MTWGPPWLEMILGEVGVREIPGAKDHPRIRWYHGFTAAGPAPDEVPWCSSLQCAMFESCGIHSTRSKAAISWKTWGVQSPLRLGAVAFFGHADPDAKGTGHVGQIAGWNDQYVLCIGGNQGNMVSAALRARALIDTLRWPMGVP